MQYLKKKTILIGIAVVVFLGMVYMQGSSLGQAGGHVLPFAATIPANLASVVNNVVVDQGGCIAAKTRCKQILKHMQGNKEVWVHEYGDPKVNFGYQMFVRDGNTLSSFGFGYEAESRTWTRTNPVSDNVASST